MGLAARFLLLLAGFLLVLFGMEWRTAGRLEAELAHARARALEGTPPALVAAELNDLRGALIGLLPNSVRDLPPAHELADALDALMEREPVASWIADRTRSSVGLFVPASAEILARRVLGAAGQAFESGDSELGAQRVHLALAVAWTTDALGPDNAQSRCQGLAKLVDAIVDELPDEAWSDPALRTRIDPWLARLADARWVASLLAGLVPISRGRVAPRYALFQRSVDARTTLAEWEHVATLRAATSRPFDPTRRDASGRVGPRAPRASSSLGALSDIELEALGVRRRAAMARVVLATRAHRARTSAAPRSLEDLAPWFGDEGVPTDPATGGPFTLTAGAKGGWADLEADEVRSWGRSPVGGRALIPTGATTGKTVLGRLHVRVR